jgi:hypothetical protein
MGTADQLLRCADCRDYGCAGLCQQCHRCGNEALAEMRRAGVDFWCRLRASARKSESLRPYPVYPELVEGLLFLQAVVRDPRKEERCFDKLRIDGFGVRFYAVFSNQKNSKPRRRLQRQQIAPCPESSHAAHRRHADIAMPPELLAGMRVGDVHFDHRHLDRADRIIERQAGMG